MYLKAVLSTPEAVMEAPLVDLAGHLLHVVGERVQKERRPMHMRDLPRAIADEFGEPRQGPHLGVQEACGEALDWLRFNGFLAQDVARDLGFVRLSRKGEIVVAGNSFARWVADQELPESMLHPAFVPALGLFRQGRLDTAVFEAFKTLEVAIREAAGLGDDLVGVKLTAKAFHPEGGPLADMSAEAGERQALLNLMGGAMGSYKNPQSHRHVGVGAAEAREMLIMASHLLKIVDSRRAGGDAKQDQQGGEASLRA